MFDASNVLLVVLAQLLSSANFVAQEGVLKPPPNEGSSAASEDALTFEEQNDRLRIQLRGQPIADYVFADPKILRPFFANVKTSSGIQVTRNHPPLPGDATDHDKMHPGIWLAFGDINGEDFWRNKAKIEHVWFVNSPIVQDERLKFATESRLLTSGGAELCRMDSDFEISLRPSGWMIDWKPAFRSSTGDILFGDQEEMGFGARVATAITEKNGGIIRNANGLTTAAATWGQAAAWCDYSGTIDGKLAGITLIADPANFRESWWHNRDYGVFVAIPFGRAAMNQGERSKVIVKRGDVFRLSFAAMIHEGQEYDPAVEFRESRQ